MDPNRCRKRHVCGALEIYIHFYIIYIHYINITILDIELELGYFLGTQCPKQGPEESLVQTVCSRGFLNTVAKGAGECCLIPLKALFLQEKNNPARPHNLVSYSGLTLNPWRHREEAFILQQTDWHCSDDNCNYHEHNK